MRCRLGARASTLTVPFCLYHTDHPQNKLAIIIVVAVLFTLSLVFVAIYVYNQQRKIRIYKLQKAQEEAMRLKVQAPPP